MRPASLLALALLALAAGAPPPAAASGPSCADAFHVMAHGHVRNDLGVPVAHVNVSAYREGAHVTSGSTSAEGGYTLLAPAGAPLGSYDLVFRVAGHTENRTTARWEGCFGPATNPVLAHTGPVLRGHVADARTGTAILGASVDVLPAGQPDAAPVVGTQSWAGVYALGLPGPGPVALRAWTPGYLEARREVQVLADAVHDVALVPCSLALYGSVVEAASGLAVPGARVNVTLQTGSQGGPASQDTPACPPVLPQQAALDGLRCERAMEVALDDQGFCLLLEPGVYVVDVAADGFEGRRVNSTGLARGILPAPLAFELQRRAAHEASGPDGTQQEPTPGDPDASRAPRDPGETPARGVPGAASVAGLLLAGALARALRRRV